jgi:hypothetical protein
MYHEVMVDLVDVVEVVPHTFDGNIFFCPDALSFQDF